MRVSNPHQLVRPPAVAGLFYPQEAGVLAAQVRDMLQQAGADTHECVPKALIVPHAGYVYSGPTAATAYACLQSAHARIRRVVVLGPVHRVPVRGLALPACTAFATPLGTVALDAAAVAALAGLPQVVESSAAHAFEHSLEVQLPFLQAVLDDFCIVPLAVGAATPAEVAEVLDLLWGGPETLLVISSDLSHFLTAAQARATDRCTIADILDLHAGLGHDQACGAAAINGLLLAARRHGLRAHLLDACNSGDRTGDSQRVVGYAALAFREPA